MTEVDENGLRFCPFCGEKVVITTHGNAFTKKRGTEIHCRKCNVRLKVYAIRYPLEWTVRKAVEVWNRRANST